MAKLLTSTLALALVLGLSVEARAQDNQAAAANAYSRAQKALLSNDYDQAAELFEMADSLSPTPQALRSAASARKAAGQLAAAAARAEELRARYPDDADSQKLAGEILDEAKEKLSRHEVNCKPEACQLLVDGSVMTATAKEQHFVYLKPGDHEVGAVFGTRRATPQKVKSAAGASSALTFEAPFAGPTAKPVDADGSLSTSTDVTSDSGTPSKGLSPWIFGTAAGVTVVLAGVATWSGLDTLSARDDYDKHRTQDGYEDGQKKERRTNILLAGTGVAAAATITLAFFTDFGGSKRTSQRVPHVSAIAAPGRGGVFVGGSF
jgi:tetratricopeptide (TPR) repeat protein